MPDGVVDVGEFGTPVCTRARAPRCWGVNRRAVVVLGPTRVVPTLPTLPSIGAATASPGGKLFAGCGMLSVPPLVETSGVPDGVLP